MSKTSNSKQQGNQYDKILKENLESALPGIIEHVLKLQIIRGVDLPDNIQHTKERKPDLLQKVTDKANKTYILYLEYQTTNDKDMALRMADYNIMLLRKYRLSVKQYVIFIGKGKMNMPDHIHTEDLQFRYNLIDLSSISYELFLKSDKPEEKILGILANFGNDEPEIAIRNIVKGVKASAENSSAESKYFRQLRVLVQLRNLDKQFDIVMESITASFFKEERDPLYRKGRQEGREEVVSHLIEKMGLTDEQVADMTGVPIAEVKKIRKKLQK